MPRSSDKRERLINAADALIHKQGFHRTTLADIARESGVPLGNVYYYFKTKEDLCKAVIDERRNSLSGMLDRCQCQAPVETLTRLVRRMADQSETLAAEGCPFGSLCSELDQEDAELMQSADGCMNELMKWSTEQFARMGLANAEDLGFEFVSRIQGVILVGNTLHDADRIRQQLVNICDWIEALDPEHGAAELAAAVH